MRFTARNKQRFSNSVLITMTDEEAKILRDALDFQVRGILEAEVRNKRKTQIPHELKILRFHNGLSKVVEKSQRGIVGKG